MNKKEKHFKTCLMSAGLVVLFSCANSLAQPPDQPNPPAPRDPPDFFYAGGPDDYGGQLSMSETWTIMEARNDEGATHTHLALGQKVRLRYNPGSKWFLDVPDSLGWSPSSVPLGNHSDSDGGSDKWRWLSQAVVQIDQHSHRICIGYPEGYRNESWTDDKIHIAVVDAQEECIDPTERDAQGFVHPGHSGAVR